MKIEVKKLGLVYKPSGEHAWGRSHAQVPFPIALSNGDIRIFFATRDEKSRSCVSFIDVDKADPTKVIRIHTSSCLSAGNAGSFDDSGTMPSWFLREGNKIILYYTAWNVSASAAYRLSIGMAESSDEGLTFQKKFEGPLMDRGIHDAIWVGQPCVMKSGNEWKMWYLSCEKIETINKRPEPFYNVKYATSDDGVNWVRKNEVCIPFSPTTDAVGRPFVWKKEEVYFMLHSNRKAAGYRTEASAGYRLVLSTSNNGKDWKELKDGLTSKSENDWDAIMNEYASVIPAGTENKFWMFYNGNGFGATGFGVAELTLIK